MLSAQHGWGCNSCAMCFVAGCSTGDEPSEEFWKILGGTEADVQSAVRAALMMDAVVDVINGMRWHLLE